MAVALWPPISAAELVKAEKEALDRELAWLVVQVSETLQTVKHGLEDCYALLSPVDPGTVLPFSTHGREHVKGVLTRVGTRIVRGTLNIRMHTLPPQTLVVDPAVPIQVTPLVKLADLIDQALDMLRLTLLVPVNAHFMNAQLRLFSALITDATEIIHNPLAYQKAHDWTTESLSPLHFNSPTSAASSQTRRPSTSLDEPAGLASLSPLSPTIAALPQSTLPPPSPFSPLSISLSLHDGNLRLHLRATEPVDAHVGLGTKLALAIGTARRFEHDEADKVFVFHLPPDPRVRRPSTAGSPTSINDVASCASSSTGVATGLGVGTGKMTKKKFSVLGGRHKPSTEVKREVSVYVREKVEVASGGDPGLISVCLKLKDVGRKVALARRNLATALGEEEDDENAV